MTKIIGRIAALVLSLLILQACDQFRPMANFTLEPQEGYVPMEVTFYNHSRSGPGMIMQYRWDFGDGSEISTEENPVHLYQEPGIYTVSLTVLTSLGTDTMTRHGAVHVRGLDKEVNADFSVSPDMGLSPLLVQFTDKTTTRDAVIHDWHWDFGDGAISEEQHPTHIYHLPGQYTVTLTLDTSLGMFKSVKTNALTVQSPETIIHAHRTVHPDTPYRPGTLARVSIEITAPHPLQLTALGVRETLPENWTYVDMDMNAGAPDTVQVYEETNEILFGWLEIPTFPVTLTYHIEALPGCPDVSMLTGEVEFRLSGPAFSVPMEDLELFCVPALEGEIEGEPVEGEPLPDEGEIEGEPSEGEPLPDEGEIEGEPSEGEPLPDEGEIEGEPVEGEPLPDEGEIEGEPTEGEPLPDEGEIEGEPTEGEPLPDEGEIEGEPSEGEPLPDEGEIEGEPSEGEPLPDEGEIEGEPVEGEPLPDEGEIEGEPVEGEPLPDEGEIEGEPVEGEPLPDEGEIEGEPTEGEPLPDEGEIEGEPIEGETEDGPEAFISLEMTRMVSDNYTYTPGEAMEITVILDKRGTGEVTDLVVNESLPHGWTFAGLLPGASPDSYPSMGEGGELTFTWDAPDALFPLVFSYAMLAPDISNSVLLSGVTRYRLGQVYLYSNEAQTVLRLNQTIFSVSRTTNQQTYAPGETIDITINYTRVGLESPLAFGYVEELPVGWTYVSLVADGGALPAISPALNTEGTLEFAWLTPPPMPGHFTYRVQSGIDALGLARFSGYGVYRFTGTAFETPLAETYIPRSFP